MAVRVKPSYLHPNVLKVPLPIRHVLEFADDIVTPVLFLEIVGVQNCEDFLHVGNDERGDLLLVLDVPRVGLEILLVGVLRVLGEEGCRGNARPALAD